MKRNKTRINDADQNAAHFFKPVATTLDLSDATDVWLIDLFNALTRVSVEQGDELVDDELVLLEHGDEGEVEFVKEDEVENFDGDSQWFFFTRGKVPGPLGGPTRGGASRWWLVEAIIASEKKSTILFRFLHLEVMYQLKETNKNVRLNYFSLKKTQFISNQIGWI